MKINQLFVKQVDRALFDDILACLDIDLDRPMETFCKCDLALRRTPERVTELQDRLAGCYLPCKSQYITDLNPQKCITLVKQVLRLYGWTLVSSERYHRCTKCVHYRLARCGGRSLRVCIRPMVRTLVF